MNRFDHSKLDTGCLAQLAQSKLQPSELVDGDDCYVLSGPSDTSLKETYWISKKTFFIRQYFRSLEAPQGGVVTPKLTDKEIEETLEGMGVEVTDESKERMAQMMEESEASVKNVKLKGFTVELHTGISFPELHQKDFKYEVPDGTELKDSLFGGIFK